MLKYFMICPRVWLTCSVGTPRELGALALFLLAQLRREVGAEILGFVHLADLDLAVPALERTRAALDPFDRLVERLALPQPEAGDQFLGLGERAVDDAALVIGELDAHALRARMQALAGQHDAGLDQFLVETAHVGQQLLARHLAGLAVLGCLDHDAESHCSSPRWNGRPGSVSADLSSVRRTDRSGIDRSRSTSFAAFHHVRHPLRRTTRGEIDKSA